MAYDSPECNFRYKVSSLEKVVDGDTIDVLDGDNQKLRIRLLGIDTPEPEQLFG